MQNPFYNGSSAGSSIPPPPSYSSRPLPTAPKPAAPAASSEPVQFSSLSDLTKNRPVPPPRTKPAFSYTPDASRAGYASGSGFVDNEPTSGAGSGGRRMPPAPSNYGVGIPPEPPKRNVPASTASASETDPSQQRPATGPAAYLPASAQGYANTASSYASAGVGKARDGIDSMLTQQRREQVTSSLGKAAAGGAKLLGQGAWKLGKFASNPTGK